MPRADIGTSRAASPDDRRGQAPPRQDEMEPEPEREELRAGGGMHGRGGAGVANYVDLQHEAELTASMRPYAKHVQDVSARLAARARWPSRCCGWRCRLTAP